MIRIAAILGFTWCLGSSVVHALEGRWERCEAMTLVAVLYGLALALASRAREGGA